MPKGDKFIDLTRYLENCNQAEIVLCIEDIAKIVGGFSPYLYNRREPWNDSHGGSFCHSWLNAGYSAQLNAEFTAVTFTKILDDCSTLTANSAVAELSIEKAVAAIQKYHHTTKDGKHTRFRSWEHCYRGFQQNRSHADKTDFLCLHLACYLASWGMLRNSFLLDYDYLVHKPLVNELTTEKFTPLFNTRQTMETVPLTLEASKVIAKAYSGNHPTETLISKILLGVFGAAPAYDKYFKDAARKYKVCSGIWGEKSLVELWRYYKQHQDVFEKLRHDISPEGFLYTPMKLMDMCLWQIGDDERPKNTRK